ncbi:phage tail protein [Fusobacterium sp. oral taxon 203]|uniref:phage tail protein n=1 Tax=Fusobacterium sp. oral taxon 203 TaxID=671211 RepID=UPI000B92834B|nr:phage tail protein [Fusobacterium sp. oral taxon 203]ASS39580.1 phage tail protein [Fusobacterium sp. oral taxon 203]
MAKTIGVLLSLKDQFTTPLQKATKSVKAMDRQLEKAGNKIKAFGNKVKAGMKTVAKWGAIGFGALTAGAVLFAKQSIDAAKDQVRIEKLLETTMKRTSNASKEQIQAIKDEASALQNVGVVGDEVALAGANQLAVYGLKSDQIKKLMPNLNDMIAKEKGLNGTQEDAVAMADVIGKAMNGKTKGLLKYGVSLTAAEEKLFKTMKQEQKMEFISKKLNESIGGTNKALRETDEGKIVAAKNAWGDMKEEVGKKLLPYLGKFAEWFETKIPAIQNFILGIADKIQELVTKAEPYITQIKDMFGKIFEKVKPALEETWQILSNAGTVAIDIAQGIINNWDRISPIVYTLVGAITAYNIATTIRNNKELIYAGIIKTKMALDTAQAILTGQLTIKQWALNAAMNANPIGIVIGAIALLVGGIWLLCKNWDLVKKKTIELWRKLDNNPLGKVLKFIIKFGNPVGAMINAFLFLKDVITQNWETIKDFAMTLWDNLVGAFNYVKDVILGVCDVVGGIFTAIWDGVVKALDKLKEGFNKVTDFITGAFMSAWDSLMKALDAILHPIETAKKAFGGLIDKLKFWNKTPADDKTINITENTKKTTETVGGANKTGIATTSIKNPRHALGTAYFKGGVTGINEGGRDETAILPAGTKILSHEEGKVIEKKNNKSITVNIHIDGNFIGEKEHMEKYGEYTANKILAALNNM